MHSCPHCVEATVVCHKQKRVWYQSPSSLKPARAEKGKYFCRAPQSLLITCDLKDVWPNSNLLCRLCYFPLVKNTAEETIVECREKLQTCFSAVMRWTLATWRIFLTLHKGVGFYCPNGSPCCVNLLVWNNAGTHTHIYMLLFFHLSAKRFLPCRVPTTISNSSFHRKFHYQTRNIYIIHRFLHPSQHVGCKSWTKSFGTEPRAMSNIADARKHNKKKLSPFLLL